MTYEEKSKKVKEALATVDPYFVIMSLIIEVEAQARQEGLRKMFEMTVQLLEGGGKKCLITKKESNE